MASLLSGLQPSDPSVCSPLLLEAVLAGSEQHVEVALQRFGSSVNKPSTSDVYPLQAAVRDMPHGCSTMKACWRLRCMHSAVHCKLTTAVL